MPMKSIAFSSTISGGVMIIQQREVKKYAWSSVVIGMFLLVILLGILFFYSPAFGQQVNLNTQVKPAIPTCGDAGHAVGWVPVTGFYCQAVSGTGGTVTAVTATLPLASSGSTTPNLTLNTGDGLNLYTSNYLRLNLGAGLSFDSSSPKKVYAPVMVGDSGAGGVAGLVPAPVAGDAAAGKFLSAYGDYRTPTGVSVTAVTATLPLSATPGSAPNLTLNAGAGLDLDGSNFLEVNIGPGLSFDSSSPKKVYAPVMVGDSGAGGVAGLAPAPGTGDAVAGKFLDAGGGYSVPPGTSGVAVRHARYTGSPASCSTSSAAGNKCHSTFTIPGGGYADTSYAVVCSLMSTSQYPFIISYAKAATTFDLYLTNGSSGEAQISYANEVDCIFQHD